MTERVLIIGSPTPSRVRELASYSGSVVVMGPEEDIRVLRRECSELDNVMLIFDPMDGTVPWQESFFTVAYVDREMPDLRRVLAPGARVLASE